MTGLTRTAIKTDGRKIKRPHIHRPTSAREADLQRQADDAARSKSLYGSLLPDVEYLRRKFPVSREGAMIRVGGVLRTEAEVREIAARERRLEQPAPAMMGVLPSPDGPRRPMARHKIERTKPLPPRSENAPASGSAVRAGNEAASGSAPAILSCGDGESRPVETTYSLECGGGAAREEMPASEESVPASAGRALDAGGAIPPRRKPALGSATGRNGDTAGVAPGPQDTIAATCPCGRPRSHYGRCWSRRGMPAPTAPGATGVPLPRVCEKCGGPRSYWSTGVCRKCYEANRVQPKSQAAQIAELRDEIAAVRAEQAAFEAKVKAAVIEMLERFDTGESR
jgi:ribosomal protein L40E